MKLPRYPSFNDITPKQDRHNPDRALEPLWKRLEEFDIHPVVTNGPPIPAIGVAREIIEDARRRREQSVLPPLGGESFAYFHGQSTVAPKDVEEAQKARLVQPSTHVLQERAMPKLDVTPTPPAPESASQVGQRAIPHRLQAALAFARGLPLERMSPPARQIYEWLQDNPEWHGRADIVASSGIAVEQWREAIAELMAARLIEATGSRRIMLYRTAS